ncbi:hypothetical protein L9F63_017833, partial [Diploptera punctata]
GKSLKDIIIKMAEGGHKRANAQYTFVGSYKNYPGVGYYKLYKFKLNWGDAWIQCKEDNAHLVVIDSDKELEVVKKLQSDTRNKDWAYVGVHDLFLNTYYVTVLDQPFITSSYNWTRNEPTDSAAENCLQIAPNGLLRDHNCNAAHPFICEYNS